MDAFLLAGLAGAFLGAPTVAVRAGLARSPEPELGPLVSSAVAWGIVGSAAGLIVAGSALIGARGWGRRRRTLRRPLRGHPAPPPAIERSARERAGVAQIVPEA